LFKKEMFRPCFFAIYTVTGTVYLDTMGGTYHLEEHSHNDMACHAVPTGWSTSIFPHGSGGFLKLQFYREMD
jgi:hypothetical protein